MNCCRPFIAKYMYVAVTLAPALRSLAPVLRTTAPVLRPLLWHFGPFAPPFRLFPAAVWPFAPALQPLAAMLWPFALAHRPLTEQRNARASHCMIAAPEQWSSRALE